MHDILAYTDEKPQDIFFDDDLYNDEMADLIDAYDGDIEKVYDGYDIWIDSLKENEPLPQPDFHVYAFDFNTGRYETWASDYLPTSVRIHFECNRSWRKRVGNLVYFRNWQDAKALKEHVETERFINPDVRLNAWGNPIPKSHYREIISDPVNRHWVKWIAQRNLGGY